VKVLDRTLILGEAHLRAAPAEYQQHHNTARRIKASASAPTDDKHHHPRVAAASPEMWQTAENPS
jgi:hypothetical protein